MHLIRECTHLIFKSETADMQKFWTISDWRSENVVFPASYKFRVQHGVTSWCVHLFLTWIDKYCPQFTNTLQAWGKQTWKISFRKCLWNFCFNGCYVFFRWKARELILWTCCPKSLSKKGWNNWGAEKLHTLAWNCLATAQSELGATEKKADEMLKRQTMKC